MKNVLTCRNGKPWNVAGAFVDELFLPSAHFRQVEALPKKMHTRHTILSSGSNLINIHTLKWNIIVHNRARVFSLCPSAMLEEVIAAGTFIAFLNSLNDTWILCCLYKMIAR